MPCLALSGLPAFRTPQIEILVCTNEQRTKQWEGFCASIERRGKERYDVIIDGANVGYFKKNAAGAGELADLRQVDWAVKKYEEEVRTTVDATTAAPAAVEAAAAFPTR